MNGDLLGYRITKNSIGFHYVTPVETVHPSGHRGFLKDLNAPRFTRHNRERSAKLCANFVYCSTRWQSTQVGTGRNQRFTISLAQSNHQRMVGDSYSKRIKAARQPARCCRRRGKDKGDRTWPAGKMVSRCASVSMVSSI